jgi:uncharacterized protein YwqG
MKEIWAQLKPRVANLATPAVRLVKTTDHKKSKIGGKPITTTVDFSWPHSNAKPMAFLVQLDLAEITSANEFDWLPTDGSLLFFYDLEEMVWGFDPKDRDKWQVIYQSEAKVEIEFPQDMAQDSKISEIYLKAQRENVLPHEDCPEIERLDLSDEEVDAYCEFKDSFADLIPLHQVGGFPAPVQNNTMELECQLASNGVYVGDPEGYQSKEAKQLESGAKDWRLLFQFDSDDDIGVMWGDCGMLYFWVREQEARDKNFENAWLILQCS